jgi:hypothetical protein
VQTRCAIVRETAPTIELGIKGWEKDGGKETSRPQTFAASYSYTTPANAFTLSTPSKIFSLPLARPFM